MMAIGLWIGFSPMDDRLAFNGAFISDEFSRFAKVVMLFASAIMLLLSQDYLRRNNMFKFEYPILIALATVGPNAGDLFAFDHVWQIWAVTALLVWALYYPTRAFAKFKHSTTMAWVKYF